MYIMINFGNQAFHREKLCIKVLVSSFVRLLSGLAFPHESWLF